MQDQDLPRHDQGRVRVNLCFACAGIWFDPHASPQLAPSAVIELFKEIYAHRGDRPQPVSSRLGCPRCSADLALSFDLSKAGRFSYYRCPRGDGRFTPFYQFLREKQFVRSLTPAELQQLRSQVRQIRCSECGAPIDLETMSQCRYCHAPVSYLDTQAVSSALQMWSQAQARQASAPSAEAVAATLQRIEPAAARSGVLKDLLWPAGDGSAESGGAELALDLVGFGIRMIGRLLAS